MKKYKVLLRSFFAVFLLGILPVQNALSQCQVTYSGSLCVGIPITFTGENSGSTHDYDFNGENTSTGQKIVAYAFNTAGNKVITYVTTLPSGSKCTSTLNLVVKESPKISLKLVSAYEQCFENNLFCFTDSSVSPIGAKIAKVTINVSDGQLFEYINPKTAPRTICFSIKDERGGAFDVYYEIEDENGCISKQNFTSIVKVREKIGARFNRTSPKNPDCDSVTVLVTNVSRISQSQVKSIWWYWGDGSVTTDWGPNLKKVFYSSAPTWAKNGGVFNSKMVIETVDGCKDSFSFAAVATVFKSTAKILADPDSTCISNPKIDFTVDTIPVGATGFLWNFGDPPTGPQNFNNRTWSPTHNFSGLGPYRIVLTYSHPICGNKSISDTILILGPLSTIEKPLNRLAEFEVFQCPKDVMDSVHFKNFSTFYHNDNYMINDDSSYYDTNDVWIHVFAGQTSVKPSGFIDPLFRERECAVRLWDFGDSYSSQCTTDRKENVNVNVNCNYSHDSLPVHYYKSWDLVMLSDFKSASMDDAIFINSTKLCKKLNVWPSDSFYIVEDSLIYIPRSSADSANALNYPNVTTKFYLKEKYVYGPGERYIEDWLDLELLAGDSLYVGPEGGPYVLKTGPQTLSVSPKQIVKLKSATDTMRILFTIHMRKDTLPVPFYDIRFNKGERPKILSRFQKIPPGIVNYDYIINYQRFRELYYARIPRCQNVRLKHWDTCHAPYCEHEAIKQLTMMHANAGGVGSGLIKDAIECLGAKNPQYGVTFILSDLKPGCTFSDVQINYDTFCDPKAWVPLVGGIIPGGRPLGLPYLGYQLQGNPPNRFSTQYTASQVCGPNGCVTVGIIVGNGVSKSGTKPLCADTQYYDKFACFPLIDPSFEVLTPLPNAYQNRKMCKGEPIVVRPILSNNTNTRDLKSLRWELATGNASPYFSRNWSRWIQEDYFSGQYLKDSGTTKIYNYMVQTRGGENVYQVPCTDIWNDGKTYTTGIRDTIVTAIISKWDTAADVSLVWDNIKVKLEARGFDPFALSPTQIAQMIWNNVGIIGNIPSGAKGCIDTTGFGKFIRFYLRPDPNFTKIIHERDTNIVPLDSFFLKGKYVRSYTFTPQWNGYHLVSISMTSANGKCDEFAAYPVIVGFAAFLEVPDSIVCADQGTSLKALTDFRYFHPDPINFGTWDPYDYWRDPVRQQKTTFGDTNSERFTKWDWDKRDDDITKPQTIFGGGIYGASGVGTPWKDLGGPSKINGGIYYENDSGVYTMRMYTGDSTGCMDTTTKRLFITRLDVGFRLNVNTPACNSTIEFFDSSYLYDPCNWAMRNCQGNKPMTCDFVREWYINWGDGKDNLYKRNAASEEGIPSRVGHTYTRNGWFLVQYIQKTDQGCYDTMERWIKIPGPRPKFEYTDKAGYDVTICEGDSLRFTNLSDSASTSADWTWFFGDTKIKNVKDTFLWHTYEKPGVFHVTLQEYDSLIVPPNIYRYCPATFPDTPTQRAFIVTVLKRDTVRGSVDKLAICPGDSITFTDNSDDSLTSYKWSYKNLSGGFEDSITVATKQFTKAFSVPGTYQVFHTADYNPNHARPWCPSDPVPLTFLVDSVIADFDIDSSNVPEFCFTRTDINGVQFRWGFNHRNDITQGPLKDFLEESKSPDKKVCTSFDSSGVYWVCLIAKNSTGCEDTICKPVEVNLFIFLANVFTPGSLDGKNDTYRVPIQGQDVFELKIFNRWGERVFQSEDPRKQWDGSVNNKGAECPAGTYFYQLKYRFKGKEKVEVISGSINLIRDTQ
ncbi:MAG: gliding motility-associated C-terminal domain-containing protein [Bacteroidetes bacterium]|nr:gliding motility-associated C-terminal domain-containing protein [Bacteroidota bacterium]